MLGRKELVVEIEDENQRLDKYILKKIKILSYIKIQKLIRVGFFKVNKKKNVSSYKVKKYDKISYPNSPGMANQSFDSNPQFLYKKEINTLKKKIIFEDDNFLVLNKPHGLSVQGGSKINFNIDLVLKFISDKNKNLKLVHRIDKNTSGLLLIAKSKLIAQEVSLLFKQNKISKIYMSICHGKPKKIEGKINFSLIKARINGKEIMTIDNENKKPSETYYRVIENKENLSFLEIRPKTGRTHQIRAHLKALGNPILGDYKYSLKKFSNAETGDDKKRMYLHSQFLSFNLKKKKYQFRANLPKHFLKKLKENNFKIEKNLY